MLFSLPEALTISECNAVVSPPAIRKVSPVGSGACALEASVSLRGTPTLPTSMTPVHTLNQVVLDIYSSYSENPYAYACAMHEKAKEERLHFIYTDYVLLALKTIDSNSNCSFNKLYISVIKSW